MTRIPNRLALIVLGLLVVLTYLLLRGSTPDAEPYERRLRAVDALILNQAALHRDVLQASHGLLRNYDPLVTAVAKLRGAADELRSEGASGPLMERIEADLGAQEDLIEEFKSSHALFQNSLAYFEHLSQRLGAPRSEADEAVAMLVGRLANAMFRFFRRSSDAAETAEVSALLNQLSSLAAPNDLRDDITALEAHGALILRTSPAVEAILTRLRASRISEQANALQDLVLQEQRQAESLAWKFRVLLYLASVLLLLYLGHLYVKLRANARALKARSNFEHLIADISAQLIDTPPEQTGKGLQEGLRRLGRYAGVDRIYVAFHGADDSIDAGTRYWCREGIDLPVDWPDRALALGSSWGRKEYERHDCIDVASVRSLPGGDERSTLSEQGIQSWLCVPLWHGGRHVGLLGLDAIESERRWADDDILLLRTAGEIFVNAFGREQAERDRQKLESRLRHAQRMEALGTLAGGIAHDFNNILGAILGYAEMALGRLRRGSREWQHVEEVRKAGNRARDVVDRILAFSRRTDQRLRPVCMAPLLEETAGLLRAFLPPSVSLRLSAEDAVVSGEPGRLQQVIMNLCTNAAHAMGDRGVIDVTLDLVVIEAERALSHGALAAGRYVRLTVRDSGHGMESATLERIFEPFFTTKAAGAGTGLGLAMVHGIVADHGGAISVRSRPGAGSSFEVYFRQAEAPMTEGTSAEPLPPLGRGETILIVDDERPLVLLCEEMVATLGYEPVGFDSSLRALAAFRSDPQRFDLVLADEMMPGMSGTELAATVHDVRPDLPIILMTGYGGSMGAPVKRQGVREVLIKPLQSADIAEAIRRHLHPSDPLADVLSARARRLVPSS